MKNLVFVVFFSFLNISLLIGQISPEEAVQGMGRGINLGNTLEPPFEGNWNNGPAEEEYFDAYLEAGFNNIRIPVRWDNHTDDSAPFAIDDSWMDRVEEVVDWGLSRDFFITINGHHEDWLKNNYDNPTLRARYDSIWVQVANRFKDKSDKLLFEIINEPNGMTISQVDDLNERILSIIRETNPTRNVIFGGNMYANAEQLFDAKILDDEYLIAYYHAYDPWQFSGQGQGTWGSSNDYQQLTSKYQSVKNWSTTNGIPIHHSEFGAIHECDFNSRMRIYAHNVEQCIEKEFAFSVWDDGGDFRVLNRSTNSWPEIKDVLMHYYPDSPNEIFSTFILDASSNPAVALDWNNRTSDNGSIVIERAAGGTSNFIELAILDSDATFYSDTEIVSGATYTYRMYTTKSNGTLLHGYPTRITITATEQTPFNGSFIPIPGEVEMEEYDYGGEGLAYSDTEPANIPNGFRQDEGVDIGALGDAYILEYVAENEWIEYSVIVNQAGTYSVDAEVASEVANGTFSITFDKNNASTDFISPSTGNWYVFQQITANNTIDLEEGEQQMRIDITNNTPFNVDKLTFNLVSTSDLKDIQFPSLKVTPNPSKGPFFIELPETFSDNEFSIEVYNLAGKLVKKINVQGNSFTVDLEDIQSGIYMLHIVNENLNLVKRIVKN